MPHPVPTSPLIAYACMHKPQCVAQMTPFCLSVSLPPWFSICTKFAVIVMSMIDLQGPKLVFVTGLVKFVTAVKLD